MNPQKTGLAIENYTFKPGRHRQKNIIWIKFDYDPKQIAQVKKHTTAKYSRTHKAWYVPDNSHYRQTFGLPEKIYSIKSEKAISAENRKALERFVDQLKLKGYSTNTIKSYSGEFIQLLKTLKSFPVDKLSPERLRAYFLYCTKTQRLSESAINLRINAAKFYFEQVLHREKMFFNIPRPKKPSRLPKAFSTIDIKKMLNSLSNKKHRLLLKLCYGMGLRVSELVKLKITDIDSNRMQVLVRQGKGKKDRYAVLPESILTDLRDYYRAYKPKDYLFEGQYGGQYSTRSVQQVFKNAMKKAKINKKVGVHSLRHSYATHLVEQGTDIRFVQDLLGHKSLKTTMIYTELTDPTKRKIKSPLDRL